MGRRTWTLGGFTLQGQDLADIVSKVTGWDDSAQLNSTLVPNTGGPGARAAGRWTPKEKYVTLSGAHRITDRASVTSWRQQLLMACPVGAEIELVLHDDTDGTWRMFVQRWDTVEVGWTEDTVASWTLPLVAPDPYKYAYGEETATVGPFLGQGWYRVYTPSWFRTYPIAYTSREYQQAQESGLPTSATFGNDGGVVSDRVMVTVSGPLAAGDWYVTNLATGDQLYADVPLIAGQRLEFDCHAQTCVLDGNEDVTGLVFGDWLTLPPGPSTFQLVAGSDGGTSAKFTALQARE